MFGGDNTEAIKQLQQEVDALTEQVANLHETLEARHAEVTAKLDQLIDVDSRVTRADIKDLTDSVESIEGPQDEIMTILDTVESIHDLLEAKEGKLPKISIDDQYPEAERVVREAGKASTSYIQRKLGVGYARAAHLIDMLEEKGVIGEADGAKPRKVIEK